MKPRIAALASLLLLAACAHRPSYFRPAERVSGLDPEGNPAALYPLRGPSGVFGEVQLSSRGITMAERDGAEHAYVHVGVELHNTSGEPLTMQRQGMRLSKVRLGGSTLTDIAPLPVQDLSVSPQTSGRWNLFFELPAGVRPLEVESFVLRWAVSGTTLRYRKRTSFIERERSYDHYHHGYVIYDVHHPYYWHYRRLGYCADPFCNTVIVYPRPPRGVRENRTRARGR